MSQKSQQITLRGLSPGFLREIKAEARVQKTSLNQVFLKRLKVEDSKKQGGLCTELLPIAGTWDEDRAWDFESWLKEHRQIDTELWS